MTELYVPVIKEKMQHKKMSMRQLAKETNIDVSTVSRIMNGKRKATLAHLQSIATTLSIF